MAKLTAAAPAPGAARQIDIALFATNNGDLDVLAIVGKVFLLQLEPWRLALHQHSERFDAAKLRSLLHKMKGSCHVVAATGTAQAFNKAEIALTQASPADWHSTCASLLDLLGQVEAELQEIIRKASSPSS